MGKKKFQKQLLKLLLVISVFIIISNDFVLEDITEIVSFGHELGNVLSNLSMAFISSYIFYYVVVVLKERKDKLNINISVHELTNQLVGRAYSVFYKLVEGAGIENFNFDIQNITLSDYIILCQKVNPNQISTNNLLGTPGNFIEATYGQLIYNNSVANVMMLSEKIFVYMPYLDTEFVHHINRLLSSTFFIIAPSLNVKTRNTDFTAYANPMFEFLELVRDLDKYNSTIIKKSINPY